MAIPFSHIVTEDGVEHRLNDTEARAMIDRLQTQVGNINLADLDFELPSDAEFDSVTTDQLTATESITIGSTQMSENQLDLLLLLANNITSIEGVYF